MTKLIGHHYETNRGTTEIFSIEVKETAKQFSKLGSYDHLYDHWAVFPKNQLDELREVYNGYCMYSMQENMSCFMELVIADLEQISVAKKIAYDKSLETLRKAQKVNEGKERSDENAKN